MTEIAGHGVGVELRAVRKADVAAKMKRIDKSVFRHLPALGQAGSDAAVVAERDQRLVDHLLRIHLVRGIHVRVYRSGVGRIRIDDNPVLAGAGGTDDSDHASEENEKSDESAHGKFPITARHAPACLQHALHGNGYHQDVLRGYRLHGGNVGD